MCRYHSTAFPRRRKGPARITLGLIDVRRDILVPALCLDDRDTARSDEQRVVCWPAFGRPFGDGHGTAFGGARIAPIGELLGIGLPAAISMLLVDNLPRGALASNVLASALALAIAAVFFCWPG